MIGLLALGACRNQPPELLTFNGEPPQVPSGIEAAIDPYAERFVYFQDLVAGEVLNLELRIEEPEGDAVFVHFADMPGVVHFDPTGTSGTMEVFDLASDSGFDPIDARMILTDDHDPPAVQEYTLSYHYEVDSGVEE